MTAQRHQIATADTQCSQRGLVPAIKYSNGVLNEEIITESAIVAQFLADSRPSHLLPASLSSPSAPLMRARIAFFTDTWNTKVQTFLYPIMKADGAEKETQSAECVKAIEKEIEPLLADAAPFFGGSKDLTMAEVIVAPFLLRLYAFSDDELVPKSFKQSLQKLPHFSKWADAMLQKESVLYIWDEKTVVSRTKMRVEKMKAAAK